MLTVMKTIVLTTFILLTISPVFAAYKDSHKNTLTYPDYYSVYCSNGKHTVCWCFDITQENNWQCDATKQSFHISKKYLKRVKTRISWYTCQFKSLEDADRLLGSRVCKII